VANPVRAYIEPSTASRSIIAVAAIALCACGSRTGLLAFDVQDGSSTDTDGANEAALPCGTVDTTVLARGNSPLAIAVDDDYVYFTTWGLTPGSGVVAKVPKCGGDVVTIANTDSASWTIALDDDSVYWGADPTYGSDGKVIRAPKSGGAATTLAVGLSNPLYIAVDDTDVYWSSPTGGIVAKVPKAGGSVTTLTSADDPQFVAVDEASIAWLEAGRGGVLSRVMVLPKNGSAPPRQVATSSLPSGLALIGGSVVWGSEGTPDAVGWVLRAPLSGGMVATLTTAPTGISEIATDGESVYFTEVADASSVARVALGGSARMVLAFSPDPLGVAVDADYVYWTDGTGKVFRHGK
jgi:hypothetical protein